MAKMTIEQTLEMYENEIVRLHEKSKKEESTKFEELEKEVEHLALEADRYKSKLEEKEITLDGVKSQLAETEGILKSYGAAMKRALHVAQDVLYDHEQGAEIKSLVAGVSEVYNVLNKVVGDSFKEEEQTK